ncbi:ATP-dependent helicase [Nocardioides agariphilus]|uniref:DNA 3'-5' helicase n=1 Tax=Nocardioides agariphilus TaxID=433664 RepID=A0A930YGV5_9ACTN|nr:ATP-dependent DNA helicase [Nocardioides agariphilus]MBF4766333.1 ATP-dependent helicase [Nocardioides agariphilus]
MTTGTTYRLVRESARALAPTLDADQQRVVDHPGGPLLVLAGPGTGKTTTLVEAIVERIEVRGADPSQVLALTFSRKAAEQLRDRVTARLGRTTGSAMCSTIHSFAYGLIRRYAPRELYRAPLRLLSAPEQDVVVRELLRPTPESVVWPEELDRALETRGFAREVQMVLSRAREKGMEADQLVALGEREQVPTYVAAGLFLKSYLDNLDDQSATDYADLIRRAVIEATAHREELRRQFRHVFVDEYQDTDPGQVALLRAIAGDGSDLVVVGDPHQSIYGFRGAEVRGILDFPADFPRADGSPAPVVPLRTTRRFGPRLLVASQRVAGRIGLPGAIDAAAREEFLHPVAADTGDEGLARVLTFDTERAEAEHLADLLRRAHLEDGVAWDQMAVLVRSGRATIPSLRRSLGAAGVPVEVARDDLPLVQDPSVLPLLDALRAAVNIDNDDDGSADYVDHSRAESLLLGPLGGLDAGDTRRLSRLLRTREKSVAHDESRLPLTSKELIRLAVLRDGFLDDLTGPEAAAARTLHSLLRRTADGLAEGGTAEDALWSLWSGTEWPGRLRRGVEFGGGAARRAHRDLDSVVALFDVAAREAEKRDAAAVTGPAGVRDFLSRLVAQQIPADTLAEQGVRGAAVRLLTAHRSKGLEWDLVVVAHVQQDAWPDLRRRSTMLQADRIGRGELVPPVTTRELLQEERRLFYVACTRARSRLVVTAVSSAEDDGEQPSRFLAELGLTVEKVEGRPARPLSLAGLVSELRRTVADPETTPALRSAAARRLARLAAETVHERALVPQADPSAWWGTRAATRSVKPVRDPDQPVPVSASMLEHVTTCPTQWFLMAEAGGAGPAHQSANIGQLVHALAQRVAVGEVAPDLDLLMRHVDEVWARLHFRTPWSAAREHERIEVALTRFLEWHEHNPRKLVGTEERFETVVELGSGEQVRLHGYADRLELDAEGRVVVVDLKTNKGKPSGPEVQRHVQLGLYQYAVDHGAVEGHHESGGAELVQLGLPEGDSALVQQQPAFPDDGPERTALRAQLDRAAALVRAETFPAVAGTHCRDCAFTAICPIQGAGSVTQR